MPTRIIENPSDLHPIPGFEDFYEINLDGDVWSKPRRVISPVCGGTRLLKARKIKTWIALGYPVFDAMVSGKKTRIFIHRALAQLFIPNPENKPEVNHKDGNKANFRLENLEWCTHKENMEHAYSTGLASVPVIQKGEECPSSKLKEDDIRSIRRRLEDGETYLSIARDYGVSGGTIGFIKSGATWGHVK